MAQVYRYKKALGVDYDTQGYIYFLSHRYRRLSIEDRRQIRNVCSEAAGVYHKALLEFVTTDADEEMICARHYISASTLKRIVRRYYRIFADRI